jgi:hypothetical protein
VRHPQGLLVVRLLLVSNGVLLGALAVLYAVFGTYVVSAVLGVGALGLWALLPVTDPYRRG